VRSHREGHDLSGELIHELATLLRRAGITPDQYHVLRVLQDAGAAGIPLTAMGERSPAGDVDVTGATPQYSL
jgi:hypothetical protein